MMCNGQEVTSIATILQAILEEVQQFYKEQQRQEEFATARSRKATETEGIRSDAATAGNCAIPRETTQILHEPKFFH